MGQNTVPIGLRHCVNKFLQDVFEFGAGAGWSQDFLRGAGAKIEIEGKITKNVLQPRSLSKICTVRYRYLFN